MSATTQASVTAKPSDGPEFPTSEDAGVQEGQLLLRLERGVRIFFIPPDGEVTSPEGETFLEVIAFKNPQDGSAEGFLEVGEWIYPLLKGRSPVLQSAFGSFIFPVFENSEITQFVGVTLPCDVTEDTHQKLVHLLGDLAAMTKQETDGVDGAKTEMAMQLFSATTKATTNFVAWGSAQMSKVIEQTAEDIEKSTTKAGEDPSVPVQEVDPKLQTFGEKAVEVATVTVRVTDAAVAQVNRVTAWLAKSLAPVAKQTAAAAVSSATGKPQNPDKLLSGETGALVSEAVKSASAMCKGMELAAFLLAKSLGDNTVKVITHVYGPSAGKLAGNVSAALLKTASAGNNVSHLGTSALARQAVKELGKSLDTKDKQ